MKDWLVPVLRHLISGAVALVAAWLLQEAGVEITADQQEKITAALSVLGAGIIGAIWIAVSKWLKPRFLRGWHPAGGR